MDTGKVIDLRTRSTYQPDCGKLARNRLLLARHSLGLTCEQFADLLTPLVGWPVTPDAVESWETRTVPPGDILIAVSTVTPTSRDRLGIRSHKFIAAHIGHAAAATLSQQAAQAGDHHVIAWEHPGGDCRLHIWPYGVVIFHLVEDLDLPSIAQLAVWRYRSYDQNLHWASRQLQQLTGNAEAAASYVLSLYWLHTPIWAGTMLDTALRIICAPRVLVDRDQAGSDTSLATAEHAERELLADGFHPHEMRSFGVAGVSLGYASWSGVAYHPLDPARGLAEDELVQCELATQAIWAYCEHINNQVEHGAEPDIADGYGWRYLRGARSRLTNPRPRETGQHRSMRDAIVATSGITGHLDQAIEALRETGKR